MNVVKTVPNLTKKNIDYQENNEFSSELNLTSVMSKTNKDYIQINYKEMIQILLSELGFIITLALIILIVNIIPENHSEKIFCSRDGRVFARDPIASF